MAEAEDGDEIIPVYIWLTDIDQDAVLAETEKQFGMSVEEAIQDVNLFSDLDWDKLKNDDVDVMDELGETRCLKRKSRQKP